MRHIIRSSTGAFFALMIAAGCATSPRSSDTAAEASSGGNTGRTADQASGSSMAGDTSSASANTSANTSADTAAAQPPVQDHPAGDTTAVASTASPPEPAAEVTTTEVVEQGVPGFAFDAAKVPPAAMPTLDELASAANNAPDSKIVIVGHTDNTGNPAYNKDLALDRAQLVRSALVRRGVDVARIEVRSEGEANPVASNDSRDGRRENRRAEVIVGESESRMVGSSQGGTSASSSGDDEQSGQHAQSGQNAQGDRNTQDEKSQNGQNTQDEPRDQREP